eukprot:gene19102-6415_t
MIPELPLQPLNPFNPRPSWPTFFVLVIFAWILSAGGICFDMINHPPSVGMGLDAAGRERPQPIAHWSRSAQFIMEGFVSSGTMAIGGMGVVLMNQLAKSEKQSLVH